jgi:hypothetical protein
MTIRYTENNRTTTNEAAKLVGLDGSSKLPAIDGSQITNITAGGAATPRTLTYDSAYGTVVTVNLARNKIYAVSSSGPNFTITSALRTSYVNGDLIYISNFGNNWFTFVNSDVVGGTKMFVNNVETTSWRVQTARLIYKIRLTTHTDGKLYVHVTDDLSILEDFADVQDTSNAKIGQTLKFNPTTGKWKAKYNFTPKVLYIEDGEAYQYAQEQNTQDPAFLSKSFLSNINMAPGPLLTTNVVSNPAYPEAPITGFGDFFLDDDYDHFMVIWKAETTPSYYGDPTGTQYLLSANSYPIVPNGPLNGIHVYLPPINASNFVGKKITFICDTFSTIGDNFRFVLNACKSTTEANNVIHNTSSSTSGTIVVSNMDRLTGGSAVLSDSGNSAVTLLAVDSTLYPTLPGSTGGANTKYGWIVLPF